MAFTRLYDDPARLQKYIDQATDVGKHILGEPSNGKDILFFNDPFMRMQNWGGNLSNNKTSIESDLRGITRTLNRDTKDNNYLNYLENNDYYKTSTTSTYDEVVKHPRINNPAYNIRGLDSIDQPNNFNYLFFNPQDNYNVPFSNNLSSRILEKDYYNLKNQNQN